MSYIGRINLIFVLLTYDNFFLIHDHLQKREQRHGGWSGQLSNVKLVLRGRFKVLTSRNDSSFFSTEVIFFTDFPET